jgi:hypothetical protein
VLRTPFELLRIYDLTGTAGAKNNDNEENKIITMSMKQKAGHTKQPALLFTLPECHSRKVYNHLHGYCCLSYRRL